MADAAQTLDDLRREAAARRAQAEEEEVTAAAGGRYRFRKEKLEVEPLTTRTSKAFLCAVCGFCVLRLLRPLLVSAAFADSPLFQDTAASFAQALSWVVPFGTVIGFLLLRAPALPSSVLDYLSLPGYFERELHPHLLGLRLLVLVIILESIHQVLACVRWQFFWGRDVLRMSSDGYSDEVGRSALATFLIVLHASGLLGTFLFVLSYLRAFITTWQKVSEYTDIATHDDSGIMGRSGKTSPVAKPSGWFARDVELGIGETSKATDGPRSSARASDDASRAQVPQASAPAPKPSPSPEPKSSDEKDTPSAPRRMSTPQYGWLWMGDEWVRVRVIRSGQDGACTVRLPGGNIFTTTQSKVLPRETERPPPRPPNGADGEPFRGRSEEPKRRSSTSSDGGLPRSTGGGAASKSPRPSSAPGPPRLPKPQCQSLEERWAATRLDELRKELIALDALDIPARRRALRQLQRELHPDKLPEDRRAVAQPLFILVQKEWELLEDERKGSKSDVGL